MFSCWQGWVAEQGKEATPEIRKLARETGALVFAFVPMLLVGKKVGMHKLKDSLSNFVNLQMLILLL